MPLFWLRSWSGLVTHQSSELRASVCAGSRSRAGPVEPVRQYTQPPYCLRSAALTHPSIPVAHVRACVRVHGGGRRARDTEASCSANTTSDTTSTSVAPSFVPSARSSSGSLMSRTSQPLTCSAHLSTSAQSSAPELHQRSDRLHSSEAEQAPSAVLCLARQRNQRARLGSL